MTSSAFMLNLRQSNVMDVPGQEIDDPDRVRPHRGVMMRGEYGKGKKP